MSQQELCLGSQTSQGIDFDCLKIENNSTSNDNELLLSELAAAVLEGRGSNLDGEEDHEKVRKLQNGWTYGVPISQKSVYSWIYNLDTEWTQKGHKKGAKFKFWE